MIHAPTMLDLLTDDDKAVTVSVTQEDIDEGVRGEPGTCPLARALNRVYRGATVLVGTLHIAVYEADRRQYVKTTTVELSHFVMDFDHGLLVRPFSFRWIL